MHEDFEEIKQIFTSETLSTYVPERFFDMQEVLSIIRFIGREPTQSFAKVESTYAIDRDIQDKRMVEMFIESTRYNGISYEFHTKGDTYQRTEITKMNAVFPNTYDSGVVAYFDDSQDRWMILTTDATAPGVVNHEKRFYRPLEDLIVELTATNKLGVSRRPAVELEIYKRLFRPVYIRPDVMAEFEDLTRAMVNLNNTYNTLLYDNPDDLPDDDSELAELKFIADMLAKSIGLSDGTLFEDDQLTHIIIGGMLFYRGFSDVSPKAPDDKEERQINLFKHRIIMPFLITHGYCQSKKDFNSALERFVLSEKLLIQIRSDLSLKDWRDRNNV